MSLYNDMRPATFDEMFGQDEAVNILKAVIETPKEKRPQVFLLEGSFGCGKSTAVEVFARAIGVDVKGADFQVMDASKDRSIDNVRNFIDMWGTFPMKRQAEGRVFLIDEAHALQTVAYEAFLKKTEKVPPMTYVFFCTTEGGKMPKALRSRCKVIPIQPMTPKAIYNNLLYVANKAGINLTEEDAQKIAMDSDNSARVSLQILENYSLNGGNAEKAISLQKGTSIKLEADTYKLCRAVISKTAKWDEIAQFCKAYSGSEEAVRIAILNYLNTCMLNSRSINDLKHFSALTECFIQPFFNAGKAGLTYMLSQAMLIK